MIEFKVQIEDKLVQAIGYNNVESYLQDFIERLQMKLAAKEMLDDLKDINLENDERWKLAREAAWKDQKDFYLDRLKAQANA